MRHAFPLGFLIALAIGFPLSAQPATEGAVTGIGVANVKRMPDLVRVQVQLFGDGKTLRDALAKLATRREACKKKFTALGAREEAITFEEPRIEAAAGDPRQQQMEMMMRARMGRGGPRTPATSPAAGASSVRVSAIVKAEWPLSAKTSEELLLAAHELQEKVKSADVGDTKLASLEEQEAREERAGMDPSEQGAPPGEPSFLYVAKLTEEQRSAATAEAFKKAKAAAGELAKAAGAELGALRQLNAQSTPDADQFQAMQYQYRYNPYLYAQMQTSTAAGNEAAAPQPGMITLNVSVTASFAVK